MRYVNSVTNKLEARKVTSDSSSLFIKPLFKIYTKKMKKNDKPIKILISFFGLESFLKLQQ